VKFDLLLNGKVHNFEIRNSIKRSVFVVQRTVFSEGGTDLRNVIQINLKLKFERYKQLLFLVSTIHNAVRHVYNNINSQLDATVIILLIISITSACFGR